MSNHSTSIGTRNLGYTLIELLIGLMLGVILVALILPVFLSNIESFQSVKSVARTHENARFVLTELSKSIRNTGFRGCDSGVASTQNLTGSTVYDFDQSISGYERTGSETIQGIDTSVVTPKTATDALRIKSLESIGGVLASDVAPSATTVTLIAGHSATANDILFIGDCENGYLFSVASISGNTLTLSQAMPANASFDNGTIVYRFNAVTYFLAASQLYTNNRGSVPTSLWRKVNTGAEQELVAGIENLQLVYGLDTDSDGVANQYVTGSGVGANFNNVTIVRFTVLASSLDAVAKDGVLQKSFSMSVNLRNFSG